MSVETAASPEDLAVIDDALMAAKEGLLMLDDTAAFPVNVQSDYNRLKSDLTYGWNTTTISEFRNFMVEAIDVAGPTAWVQRDLGSRQQAIETRLHSLPVKDPAGVSQGPENAPLIDFKAPDWGLGWFKDLIASLKTYALIAVAVIFAIAIIRVAPSINAATKKATP